ncbi:hypothetical protein AGOR_G00119480 [Albula goreensis]|uniref:Uncharacterized protein n=1 Tax=Albula goreensis TaxID=1534307 RepID=A0A8T3DF99_9TELE|nr:hypothetical protein AGOR_G00119480 [Albula goreensis]
MKQENKDMNTGGIMSCSLTRLTFICFMLFAMGSSCHGDTKNTEPEFVHDGCVVCGRPGCGQNVTRVWETSKDKEDDVIWRGQYSEECMPTQSQSAPWLCFDSQKNVYLFLKPSNDFSYSLEGVQGIPSEKLPSDKCPKMKNNELVLASQDPAKGNPVNSNMMDSSGLQTPPANTTYLLRPKNNDVKIGLGIVGAIVLMAGIVGVVLLCRKVQSQKEYKDQFVTKYQPDSEIISCLNKKEKDDINSTRAT